MRAFLMLPAVALVAAAPAPEDEALGQIEAALSASAKGWNAGDLDRYMAIYAPDATYMVKQGVVQGKAAIADRYRPAFVPGGNARGKLEFGTLGYRSLTPAMVMFYGKWTLTKPDGTSDSGTTSLLFERRKEGWRIIADHSS
jgi:uncharacterized protein (TIGR02246 family)